MAITKSNVSRQIEASYDGVRYAAYPAGDKPEPGGGGGDDAWAYELLSTGIDAGFTQNASNKGTISWNAGGFARLTHNVVGVVALEYPIPDGHPEILVQFDLRRFSSVGSKQLKIFSRSVTTYPNAITGPSPASYSGGRAIFTYSDNDTGGDNDCEINLAGNFRGGTTPTKTPAFTKVVAQASDTAVQQSFDGTVWETWKVWFKAVSNPTTPDGELAVWKDGVLVLHLTDMWNCATTDGVSAGVLPEYRNRGKISLGDWAPSGGWYEDYRNLKIGFTRPGDLT